MKLCCNCSECHAIARCNQCPVENSFYCKACMNVHKQIRSSRDHTFFELNNVCENCEKHIATHQCVDCLHSNIHNTKMIVGSYEDCLFCKDCSILHLKLKSYAKHEVVAVDDESCVVLDENNASLHQSTHFLNANSEKVNKNLIQSDTNPNRYPSSNNSNFKLSWEEFVYVLEDTKDMLCNMLIDLYDIIMTFVPYQQRNWYSIMKGFGIALGIYIIVNLTFGKMPLFFYFIIALILFLFYKHQENELLRSIKSIQNVRCV